MMRRHWSNDKRFDSASGLIALCLAVFFSVASMTVAAQTVFEFEDPLDELRERIERTNGSEAAPMPTPKAEPASDVAPSTDADAGADTSAALADVKGPVTIFAERLGLPTAGVIGLGVLGLLALLLGAMWWINRRKAARTVRRKDQDLYAVSRDGRARRTLESGAKIARNRKQSLDTAEAAPSAAAAAARILSDAPETDEDLHEEHAPDASVAATEQAATDPKDPSTWQRPNLDRLKASIRDDWAGKEEVASAPEQSAADREAQTFADLFGDDNVAAPATATAASNSSVLDILDTYPEERAPTSVANVTAGADQTTTAPPVREAARPAAPSREDAVRRIRALRESVRAS